MKVFTLQILNNDVLSKKFCEVDLPELHQQSQNVAWMPQNTCAYFTDSCACFTDFELARLVIFQRLLIGQFKICEAGTAICEVGTGFQFPPLFFDFRKLFCGIRATEIHPIRTQYFETATGIHPIRTQYFENSFRKN